MTQLLISVTSIEEAKIAIKSGTNIIDLKDPHHGALGALPKELICNIIQFVSSHNSSIKTSATIGDIPMEANLIQQHVIELIDTHVDFIKIGFFELDDYQPVLDALRQVTQRGVKLIAVLFAESKYPEELIDALKRAGFFGVMLDTAKKNGQTLFDYYSTDQLQNFARMVFKQNLILGLAGSLRLQHIALLKEITPTYIGLRGGVCIGNERKSCIDADKIKAICEIL